MEDVIAAVESAEPLPLDAALLTFDDGYAEHFDTVFPILHDRGLQGSFFPPVAPVRAVLSSMSIGCTLASAPSPVPLGEAVDEAVRSAWGADEVDTVMAYPPNGPMPTASMMPRPFM